jgi:hypothetical protein
MPSGIPDLWRAKEDASRLYSLYLAHLSMNGRYEQVVAACPKIRRYAARGPGAKEALFAFSFELDALVELKRYRQAWRRLRLREETVFGKRFNLLRREWSADDSWDLCWCYAPLLFFLGRYRQGCALLEISLDSWFGDQKVRSYDVLFHVYNGDEEPDNRCRVTLKHFYTRLGKNLSEWRHWEKFVNGFHPRLFRLAGVSREELLADSEQLGGFFDNLMGVRAERTTSGVTRGQADLIESPRKVQEWQEATQAERLEFHERSSASRKHINNKLRELFPEIASLLD